VLCTPQGRCRQEGLYASCNSCSSPQLIFDSSLSPLLISSLPGLSCGTGRCVLWRVTLRASAKWQLSAASLPCYSLAIDLHDPREARSVTHVTRRREECVREARLSAIAQPPAPVPVRFMLCVELGPGAGADRGERRVARRVTYMHYNTRVSLSGVRDPAGPQRLHGSRSRRVSATARW